MGTAAVSHDSPARACSAAGQEDSLRYGQVTSVGGGPPGLAMVAATTRQTEESTAACPIDSCLM